MQPHLKANVIFLVPCICCSMIIIACLTASCSKDTPIRTIKAKLGADTSYYKKFAPRQRNVLTFQLNWSLQTDTTLFIAKVNISEPYSGYNIVSVVAHTNHGRVVEIPPFDANLSHEVFYKAKPRQLQIYRYFSGPPLKKSYNNQFEALLELMNYTYHHTGFHEIAVTFDVPD